MNSASTLATNRQLEEKNAQHGRRCLVAQLEQVAAGPGPSTMLQAQIDAGKWDDKLNPEFRPQSGDLLTELLFGNHRIAGSPEQGERDCMWVMELAAGITIPEKMLLLALAANKARSFTLDHERLSHQTLMDKREMKKAAAGLLRKHFISIVDGALHIACGR